MAQSKIKVLHVHTLPVVTGSGIHTLLLMRGLPSDRYETHFACAPGGGLIDQAKKNGAIFVPIKDFRQPISPWHDLAALFELIRAIRRNKYTIVHSHNSKAGFIGRLAAKICRVPIIIHTIHGFSFHPFENRFRRWLFINLERLAALWADKLIAVSSAMRQWGLSLRVGRPDQYVTIYDGIDLDQYSRVIDTAAKKKELGFDQADLIVGMAAKLWPGKGHVCLLRAAKIVIARYPKAKFLLAGEGHLEKKLKSLTDELGLKDNVVFSGFRQDIIEVTAVFDIAVLASFYEGLGRVLLEAMALAKPVVATNVGGIPDLIEDGVNGILVEAGDSESLAQALLKLLADQKLRGMMGQAAKARITDRFSAETMVRRNIAVYEELLKAGGYAQ